MAQTSFTECDLQSLVTDSCNQVIKQNVYNQETADQVTEQLIEDILKRLAERKKDQDYKFLVSAVIEQKIGAGVHSVVASVWDNSMDSYNVIKWENPSYYVAVTIFCLYIDK